MAAYLARRWMPKEWFTGSIRKILQSNYILRNEVKTVFLTKSWSNILLKMVPVAAIEFFRETGILLAVPKKRVSHRRKRIRNHSKFPKNRTDIETCVVCGNEKLQGYLCGHCLENIREETAQVQAGWPKLDSPQPLIRG
eukprot:gene14526-5589_t